MITVTRINDEEFILNSDLIECVFKTPDTVITLTTGKKLMVKETPEQIVDKVVEFRHRIYAGKISVENQKLD